MKKTTNVSLLLFGNTQRMRVLNYFMELDGIFVTESDVARGAEVSKEVAFRIIGDLVKEKIVRRGVHKRLGGGWTLNKRSHLGKLAAAVDKCILVYQIGRMEKAHDRKEKRKEKKKPVLRYI